jgi:hypothetical protein
MGRSSLFSCSAKAALKADIIVLFNLASYLALLVSILASNLVLLASILASNLLLAESKPRSQIYLGSAISFPANLYIILYYPISLKIDKEPRESSIGYLRPNLGFWGVRERAINKQQLRIPSYFLQREVVKGKCDFK